MRVQTLSDQLFFVTAYVHAKGPNGERWTGTAFVYGVTANGSDVLMLVSNRHVFERAVEFTIRMVRAAPDGGPLIGSATEISISNADAAPWWHGHPDPRVDVAVMPLAAIVRAMTSNGAPPFFRAIPSSVVPSLEQRTELNSVEQITFVGYPAGIYDKVNFVPIVRQGYTATPIELDYNGLPAFLVDASVFPGSSGSPVLIAHGGPYSDGKGTLVVGQRLFLLGVLAAVHQRQVLGAVVELPGAHVAVIPETLDLGIVYRADAIDACVDLVLPGYGLTRDVA